MCKLEKKCITWKQMWKLNNKNWLQQHFDFELKIIRFQLDYAD